ncbi:ROK family transcriptional regulator [Natronospora cellulosivora (SeqCode)]
MEHKQVANSQYIRDLNLTAIFRLIHKYGPVSRKELAENTGYSAATISNHVKRLLESRFVIETDKGSSTGGRKPVFLTINPERRHIIAVEIEVNHLKIMIVNLKFQIKGEYSYNLENRDAEYVLAKMMSGINYLQKKTGLSNEKIMGLGIAVPALVDTNKAIVNFAPNLEWKNIDMEEKLKDYYQTPLLLENEARAAVIGEKEFIYPDIDNLVYVSINQGIGCGIIFDGRIYRGASSNAGEFGHIIIDSHGPECHCGNYGCWETLASLNYILSRYSQGKLDFSLEDLRKKALAGDKELELILKETGENIGIGIVNIINSLSPEHLIIGGDITDFKDYIDVDLKGVIKEKSLDLFYQKVNINYSQLSKKASLYGIARMVFDSRIEEEIFAVV